MKKTILVVAAHPDDELLGAGATLIKHVEDGDRVFALILGQGVAARDGGSQDDIDRLQEQGRKAAEVAGFKDITFLSFPDNAFDTVSLLSIVKEVEKRFEMLKPDVVYTHFPDDLNIDHRRTFEAVLTAARPVNSNAPKQIYAFETLSSTEWQRKSLPFSPSHYVDVERTMDRKIKALAAYASEMRPYPHPRSAEGVRILAQYRGLESGLRHAEAFMVVRSIAL